MFPELRVDENAGEKEPTSSYREDGYGEPDEPVTVPDDEPTGPEDYPVPALKPPSDGKDD